MDNNIKIAKELLKIAKNMIAGEFDDEITVSNKFDDTISITAGRFDDDNAMESPVNFKGFIEKSLDEWANQFTGAKNKALLKDDSCNLNLSSMYQKDYDSKKGKAFVTFSVVTHYDQNPLLRVIFYVGLNNRPLFYDKSKITLNFNMDVTGNDDCLFFPKGSDLEKIAKDIQDGFEKWKNKWKNDIVNAITECGNGL